MELPAPGGDYSGTPALVRALADLLGHLGAEGGYGPWQIAATGFLASKKERAKLTASSSVKLSHAARVPGYSASATSAAVVSPERTAPSM
jgi:hypothetical protein